VVIVERGLHREARGRETGNVEWWGWRTFGVVWSSGVSGVSGVSCGG